MNVVFTASILKLALMFQCWSLCATFAEQCLHDHGNNNIEGQRNQSGVQRVGVSVDMDAMHRLDAIGIGQSAAADNAHGPAGQQRIDVEAASEKSKPSNCRSSANLIGRNTMKRQLSGCHWYGRMFRSCCAAQINCPSHLMPSCQQPAP